MKAATLILTLSLTFIYFIASAQTPPPSGGSGVGAPLDGITGLLLMAGVGYGIKRIGSSESENT